MRSNMNMSHFFPLWAFLQPGSAVPVQVGPLDAPFIQAAWEGRRS